MTSFATFILAALTGVVAAGPNPANFVIPAPDSTTPAMPGTNTACKDWHLVRAGESCDRIVEIFMWNPQLGNPACDRLWSGYKVCIGVAGAGNSPAPPNTNPPLQPGNCKKFRQIMTGDSCEKIVDEYKHAFTLQDLHTWNPWIDANCFNLYPDTPICVGA